MAAEYKELDRCLKEKFMNGLNEDGIVVEIIHELTSISDKSSVASEQVMAWVRRVEARRAHTAQKAKLKAPEKSSYRSPPMHRSKYCISSHLPQQCLKYGKCVGDVGN